MSKIHAMPSAREFSSLRGEGAECNDLYLLAGIALVCFVFAAVAYWLRAREEWRIVAEEKRAADWEEKDVEVLELEAGRRYNIPVEYLRGMEIRVR